MIYLGIDCGTQSLKVLAWDPEKEVVGSASKTYGLIEGLSPGHKEQHPDNWIIALTECVQDLRAQEVDLETVCGIGISGQQHGLVVLDERHQVIRPAKLWCDTSTESQCRKIVAAAGGPEAYRSEVGNALPPGFTASKVLWLKENEPSKYAQVCYMLLPHDYLNFYLTGEMVSEAGDASGTGYFNVRKRQWSAQALSWIDSERNLMSCLPRLIESQESTGQLRPSLAKEWGMRPEVLVSSGGGDNMMGAIGSGNVALGTVTVSLGTSGTLYTFSDSPIIDPDGEIAAFCDSTGGWLPLGCTMNVTVATEMIRTGFGGFGLEEFNRLVEGIPAGSEGLVLLPYLEGERMPNVALGTGVLLGLRPRTASTAHLARAAMEGATLGLYYGMERFSELGVSPAGIRLIGGGAKSKVWRQMVADIFGISVVCPKNQEGPAFGAALQAFWCCEQGEMEDLVSTHVMLDESTRHQPIPEMQDLYSRLYLLYKRFSRTLIHSDVFETHREFIGC